MIADIYTATHSRADGIPTTTWAYKETRVANWSPIGFTSRVQMGLGAGGQTYPADSRVWLEWNTDILVGNRLYQESGTIKYDVLSVFSYEDHKEAELRKVVA